MNELRDRLRELFPPDTDADWDDVVLRAGSPSRRARRLTLLFAAALLATLAVGSALALSGRLGGLLHGTPVKNLTPRERFLLSEFDMKGKVELIAKRNSLAFYVIRRPGGQPCYSIGDLPKNLTPAQREERTRFGATGCIDPRAFPSRAMPVLDFSFYSFRRGDTESRLAGLRGFAADPVAAIGVIGRDNRIGFSLPVEHNVYTAGKRGFPGARGLVGLDKDGDVLWVRCFAIGRSGPAPQFPSGGCGKFKSSPPPHLPAPPVPKPIEPRGPVVVQRGNGDGVSVLIRGAAIEADFRGLSAEKRRLLRSKDGRINLGCFKLVNIGGKTYTSGTGYLKPFSTIVRIRPAGFAHVTQAPFDACTAMGMYGHKWNDARGTHDTVEVPLTPRGRRFLAERATARDIAWLARAERFRSVRYAKTALDARAVARGLGSHVVPLESPDATPRAGKLGIWLGKPARIVLVERAPSGRRLYLEIRHGVIYRTNLIDLAAVL